MAPSATLCTVSKLAEEACKISAKDEKLIEWTKKLIFYGIPQKMSKIQMATLNDLPMELRLMIF